MKILIVYATNSGGTEEACEIVRDVLANAGHVVLLQRASSTKPEDLGMYDLTILAAGTWEHISTEGVRQESALESEWRLLREQSRDHRASGKHFAVIGLGDTRYTHFAAAADHLEGLVKIMGGVLVGSLLRVDGFFFHLGETRKQVRAWTDALLKDPFFHRES